jgi:hypothetical protein
MRVTLSTAPVTILSSAIGLGVYIPALLIDKQLQKHGISSAIEILECYYTQKSREGQVAHIDAFQQDFALAKLAHRMSRDISDSLDPLKIDLLLAQWAGERREHFIVWSGFWLPIIERYRQLMPRCHIKVDHCRIDAEVSASFKIFYDQGIGLNANTIWLWQGEKQKIVHEIRIDDAAPIAFEQRSDRLVMHGGGWGIGTYKSKVAELSDTQYALDIVVANTQDIKVKRPQDRFFMLDPNWQPWEKNKEGAYTFPPMLTFENDRENVAVEFNSSVMLQDVAEQHAFYQVIREAKAIISKPGGCTLIDSLNGATPVILLEPYGYAEKRNAEIWQTLGFGISLGEWRASGYDDSILHQLHCNLLAQKNIAPNYVANYIEKLTQETAQTERFNQETKKRDVYETH